MVDTNKSAFGQQPQLGYPKSKLATAIQGNTTAGYVLVFDTGEIWSSEQDVKRAHSILDTAMTRLRQPEGVSG